MASPNGADRECITTKTKSYCTERAAHDTCVGDANLIQFFDHQDYCYRQVCRRVAGLPAVAHNASNADLPAPRGRQIRDTIGQGVPF